jgi:hypothetical protein
MAMSFEDRGKYITLLSLMHQQGRLPEETIRFLIGSFSRTLTSKFKKDENGLWYNERLEQETLKRQSFVDSRRANGLKGGRGNKANGKPKGKPKKNLTEDVNENENVIKNEVVNSFSDPSFNSLWDRWKLYKNKEFKFKYKSAISEQSAQEKLMKLSGGNFQVAEGIITQSIENGYKGFFPLTKDNNVQPQLTQFKDSLINNLLNGE